MDGSDIRLYLSWKPDRVDKRLQEYLRQGDEGRARQLSQTLSSVERLWKSFILDQSRGELISLIGDGITRACVPADALEGVEKIRVQAGRFLQSPLSVGVGLSMVDADLALKVAVKRGGDQIQLWDRETMAPELEPEDQQKLKKADGPPGPKAEETPSNKGNAGGGFTPRSEGQVGEKPVPPRAEGSEHSQGEVARAAAEEFSGPEATQGATGDPEQAFRGHADAQEEADQREVDQAQAQDGVRAKVVEILKQVREAAPQLEQLQQASPELYAVLMDMTQALILTARAMVEGDDGQAGGEEDPVQKSELAKAWPRDEKENSENQTGFLDNAVAQDQYMEGTGASPQIKGTPTKMARTPALEQVYWQSAGRWRGADWDHYLGGYQGDEDAPMCHGEGSCTECRDAAKDAAMADELGRRAMEAARVLDWPQAVRHANEAAKLESNWGDSPTWGPFLDIVSDYAEADEDSGPGAEIDSGASQNPGWLENDTTLAEAETQTPRSDDPGFLKSLAKTWPRPISPEDQGGKDPLRDPEAQRDAQLLAEVNRDAVLEGNPQVKEIGVQKIPLPQGAPVSGNKRAINAEKRYHPIPKLSPNGYERAPGWEMTPAASDRVEGAARFNDAQPRGQHSYAGQEPASRSTNILARGGFPVAVRDQDTRGRWDTAPEEVGPDDRRFWGDTIEDAQAQAFPIPQHDPHTGPDPHGRVWHYHWQYNPRAGSWGINTTLRHRDGDNPYGYGPREGRSEVGPYYAINPQTGLLAQESTAETSDDPQYEHQRLNQFLASLGGLHKSEHQAGFRNKITGDLIPTGGHHDVDQIPGGEFNPEDYEEGFIRKSDGEFLTREELQKAKLPMPENAPKFKFRHPVGASKDGKVKIRHQDGTSSWVSVRAGQVLSNDGHAISSRNPSGR